jgi:hypothetical protein
MHKLHSGYALKTGMRALKGMGMRHNSAIEGDDVAFTSLLDLAELSARPFFCASHICQPLSPRAGLT